MKNSTRTDPETRKKQKRKASERAGDKISNSKPIQDNVSDVKKKKISAKSEKKKLAKLFNEKLCLLDTPPKKREKSSKSEKEKLAELFGAKVTLSSPKHETQIIPLKAQENIDETLTSQHKETKNSAKQSVLQEFPCGQQKKKKSKRKKDEENKSPTNEKSQTITHSKESGQGGVDDDLDKDEEKRSSNMSGFCPPPGIVHESLMKVKEKTKKKTSMDVDEGDDGEEEKPKKMKRDTSKDFKTVFVGNLPVATDKKGLHKIFKKFGSIESVRLRCAPRSNTKLPKRAAVILKDFHPERDNISAYVCFRDEDGAKKALKMNGKLVGNLHIRVDMSNHDPKTDFKRSIFVGNLSLDVKEEDIRSHFISCGKIRNVRVIRDNKSGVGKGICYVTFKSKDSVALAMKLKGTELSGRKVRIEHCLENPQKEQKMKKEKKSQRKEDKHKKKPHFHMRPSNVKSSAVFQKKIHPKQKRKKKRQGHRK